jgi:CDP-diglyceride synthetase
MTATTKPERIITLPTGRLLLTPTAGCIVVAACWAGVAAAVGAGAHHALGAGLAGAVATAAAVVSMLLIAPWRKRPAIRWPFVFLAGILLQMLLTLVGGLVLYSASFGDTASTWLCLVVSFWAGLAGVVWVYGSHMKRWAPAGGAPPVARQAASVESSE